MTPDTTKMPLPPDAYAAGAIGIALLLEWLVPLRLLPEFGVDNWALWTGVAIAVLGFALEVAAARTLVAGGAATQPNAAATALVTDGVFEGTRNPFYVGIVMLLSGVLTAVSLDWVILIAPAFWLALDRLVIPYEERRLAAAFGPAFSAYAAKTPRWLF